LPKIKESKPGIWVLDTSSSLWVGWSLGLLSYINSPGLCHLCIENAWSSA
jgi:hypothetical protein